MELWKFFGLITILSSLALAQNVKTNSQVDNQCESQENCINIKLCAPFLNLLRSQARNNRTVQNYLRSSICGYDNNDPKVCCPLENYIDGVEDRARLLQPISLPVSCGKSSNFDFPRIVGGRSAEKGQWPWMAALGYMEREPNDVQWLCGGALISQKHVITAAHCLFHPSLKLVKVKLGVLDLNDNNADSFDVEKQIPHENYSTTKFTNDIGLVKLVQPVQFTDLIQPICLPSTPEIRSNNFKNVSPFAAGWGSVQFRGPSSSRLQEIQLPVLDNSICVDRYKSKGVDITSSQLCAGYLTGGKDTCNGDSGGPLMWPKGETFYVIGVVSFGFKCGEVDYPSVYTRVTEYIDWISTNIQK